MYVTDSNFTVSSWMAPAASTTGAGLGSVTDRFKADRAVVDLGLEFAALVAVIRRFFGLDSLGRMTPATLLANASMRPSGQASVTAAHGDDDRWTAFDPKLPRVANNNAMTGDRVA